MSHDAMPFSERRLLERKQCSRVIDIHDDTHTYTGRLHNLSVGGAFIDPGRESGYHIGQNLLLTIPFGLKHAHVNVSAKITWVQSGGIGVRFIQPANEQRNYH